MIWAGPRVRAGSWALSSAERTPCDRTPGRTRLVRNGRTVQVGLEEKGPRKSW